MTGGWTLVLFYNMIKVSAINTFVIWQGINQKNDNICIRQRRKFLISLGSELCGIIEEAHPVVPISATRIWNVTLAGNGALLNKRAQCTLCDQKKGKNANLFCCRCGKYIRACPEHLDIVCINWV